MLKRSSRSQILLVLLSAGDAYIVDLRKKYRTRVELCEVEDEAEDEAQDALSSTVRGNASCDELSAAHTIGFTQDEEAEAEEVERFLLSLAQDMSGISQHSHA